MLTSVLPLAAPAPAEVTPGIGDGEILGSLGAGGAALVVTVVLWFGMKAAGKGKQLPWALVLFLAMLAATFYAAAGGFWSLPADILGSLLAALGIGGGGGALGNVGMGAVACCIAAVIYWKKLSLPQLAIAGFVMAYVAGRAGGIWGVAADFVGSIAKAVGV